MSYKAAFFDIDWTLFDHKNHDWDRKSIEAVKGLRKRGIDPFVCTARSYDAMVDLGILDLGIDWRGYVASAGALAVVDGKTVQKTTFSESDVIAFAKLVRYLHVSTAIIYPDACYFYGEDTSFSDSFFRDFGEKKKRFPGAGRLKASDVIGFNLLVSSDYDALFAREFPHFSFFRYTAYGMDVMPCPHEKASGLEAILGHLGLRKEEAIFFGDSLQDISMGKASRFVALGNAAEEVKRAADEITSPVWENGVYASLLRHGLTEE